MIRQAQLLEGEAVDGLGEGHAGLADLASGVERIGATKKVEHHLEISDRFFDSAAFFMALAYSSTDISL